MADFVAVAHLDQLPPGRVMTVTVRGLAVAIFNVAGTVYAMEDACRHAGASLGGGELRGTIVRCPAHGWRYDVCTGQTLNEPDDGVASFPVQVVDGTILVALVERSRTVMEDGLWSATTRRAMVRRVERVAGGISLGMTRLR